MEHILEQAILVWEARKSFPHEIISKKKPEWWVGVNVPSEGTRCVTFLGRETERKPIRVECVEWGGERRGDSLGGKQTLKGLRRHSKGFGLCNNGKWLKKNYDQIYILKRSTLLHNWCSQWSWMDAQTLGRRSAETGQQHGAGIHMTNNFLIGKGNMYGYNEESLELSVNTLTKC